jgi:hypothetical protein
MAHLDPIQGITVKDTPKETTFFSRIKQESKQKVRRIRRHTPSQLSLHDKKQLGIKTEHTLTDDSRDISDRFKR